MTEPTFLQGEVIRDRRFAFRIDEEKAFQKLRDFRVTEPERYVLELLMCAFASGASRVSVESGVWTFRLHFDGDPFDADGLGGVYHHLVEEGEGGTTRLSHLASGLVMLSHLEPREVSIRSGTVCLTETWPEPNAPRREVTEGPPHEGTTIEVSHRRRFQPLQLLGIRETAEEAVIRARLLLPPCEVVIDGEVLEPAQPQLTVSRPIEADGIRGVLGLAAEYGADVPLLVCYRGVLIQERTYQGVGGVLSSAHLRRNISLNDVLDDAAYKALLLQARRSRRVLERELAAERLDQLTPEQAATDELIQRLMTRLLPWTGLAADDPVRARLERLPVLRDTAGLPVSLARLVGQLRARHPSAWPYTRHKSWNGEPALFYVIGAQLPGGSVADSSLGRTRTAVTLKGQTVVRVPTSDSPFVRLRPLVERYFADRTKDVRRVLAEQRFLEQPSVAPTLSGEPDVVVTLDAPGLTGELGMLPSTEPGVVRLLWRGRPAGRLKDGLWPGVVGVVDVADLEMRADFKGASRDARFQQVTESIRDGQIALLDAIVSRVREKTLNLDGGWRRHLIWLASERVKPLRAQKLLPSLGGQVWSFDRVRNDDGPFWLLTPRDETTLPPQQLERCLELAGTAVEPNRVLLIGDELATAHHLTGSRIDADLHAADIAERDPARAADAGLLARFWPPLARGERHAFERDGVRGEIVLTERQFPRRGLAWVRGDRIIELPITGAGGRDDTWLYGPVHGWVAWDELPAALDRSAVNRQDDRFDAIRLIIERAVADHVEELAPNHRLRLGYIAFHYERDRRKPGTFKVRKQVVCRDGRRRPMPGQRIIAPRRWTEKTTLPVLGGEPMSLAAIDRALEGGTVLGFVPEDATIENAATRVDGHAVILRLDDEKRAALGDLFPLTDITEAVRQAQQQSAFFATRARQEPVLPESVGPRRAFSFRLAQVGQLSGEVALDGEDRVTVLFQGRRLSVFPTLIPWASVEGIVDVETLGESDGLTVPDATVRALREVVTDEAITLLAEQAADGAADPRVVRRFIIATVEDARGRDRLREASTGYGDDLWQAFTTTPIFRSVGGARHSVADAMAFASGERLPWVPQARSNAARSVADDAWWVLNAPEVRILERLIGEHRLDDALVRAEREQRVLGALERAPRLETGMAPDDARYFRVVRTVADSFEVTGICWIPGILTMPARRRLRIALDGHEVYSREMGGVGYPLVAHLTCDALRPGPDGHTLVARDRAFEAVLRVAERVGRPLVRRLLNDATARGASPALLEAASLVALSIAAHEWDERGPAAFDTDKPVFETPLFERADGQGLVSLRVLIEDHQADGEVGYLDAVASPELLGRDLAVVVRSTAIRGAFLRLFPRGFVDYRERLRQAPSRRFGDRLRDELDKYGRTLEARDARAVVAAMVQDFAVSHDGDAAPLVAPLGEGFALNADHPRFMGLQRAVDAGRDIAPIVLAVAAPVVLRGAALVDFLLALRPS